MFSRTILKLVILIACVTSLAVGYAMAGQWIALLGILFALVTWLLACKWRSGGLAVVALVLSVCLAIAGLLASVSPELMILGAALALASWDGVLWDQRRTDISSDKTVDLLEKRHYQSLALALGVGFLVAVAGRMFRIQMSFGWMTLLVILVLIGLERLWRTLRQ